MDATQPRPTLQGHVGNGILLGHFGAKARKEQAQTALTHWRREGRGPLIITKCPPAWKADLDVWGPPPADAWLMRAVKAQFDPSSIFNPGRFVDGI